MEKYVTYNEKELKIELIAMRNCLNRLKDFKKLSSSTIQDEIDRLSKGVNSFNIL